MIWIALIACNSDINMVADCEAVDSLLVCHNLVNNQDAQYMCADADAVLLDTTQDPEDMDYNFIRYEAAVGTVAFNNAMWWSGLDAYSGCVAQIHQGGWVERDCEELHPFICSTSFDESKY